MKQRLQNLSLKKKLIIIYLGMTCFILFLNLMIYQNVNNMLDRLNKVYVGNVYLNELQEALDNVQLHLTEYLNTKSTDSMDGYYKACQEYTRLVDGLSGDISDQKELRLERNIKRMSLEYLRNTDLSVEAKRGRNIEKYRDYYNEASNLYQYIHSFVYDLNNDKFKDNMTNYSMLTVSISYVEMINTFVFVITAILNIILVSVIISNITRPLKTLSIAANEVATGNLEIEPLTIQAQDEVGVVSKAFNQMVVSIKENIEQLKCSMEHERELTEKELKMEAHLKDAKLKYLQAQISPHFLFNTLNAGAQLAMMEGADRTYDYIQNVADFYRYNLKKDSDIVTLKEELELIDHYIFILNVRFSGEIHYEKKVDDIFLDCLIPSMILQPIVENSVNYGIRGIEWQGKITIQCNRTEEGVELCIEDNGIGISEDKIQRILSGEPQTEQMVETSNGIGLGNVINRLRLFYNREDVFWMECDGENMGTRTKIRIPTERKEPEYPEVTSQE